MQLWNLIPLKNMAYMVQSLLDASIMVTMGDLCDRLCATVNSLYSSHHGDKYNWLNK